VVEVSHKVIQRALEDCETLNTLSQWAVMKVTNWAVTMEYGAIWPNGERETAIATRIYFFDGNGVVFITRVRG